MPSWANEQTFDTGGPLAGFVFSEGWYNILTGMNYLPYSPELHRNNNIGAFDQYLQDNMGEADKLYEQLVLQRQQIEGMPSHYQFLKHEIYDGKE